MLDYTDRLAQERRTLADYERQREQIAAALRDTQARLRLGGSGTAIGPWLWQQRQSIPSLLELKIKRADAQKQLTALRLRLYSSAEERYALTRSRLQAAMRVPMRAGRLHPHLLHLLQRGHLRLRRPGLRRMRLLPPQPRPALRQMLLPTARQMA